MKKQEEKKKKKKNLSPAAIPLSNITVLLLFQILSLSGHRLLLATTAPSSSSCLAVGKESLASSDLDRGLVSPEYPWAAKMNPSVRNLHQVTNPSFMEDGTPKVCIPRQVLLEGVENQKKSLS